MRYKQLARYLWHRWATLNTGIIMVAAFIVLSWVWGSVSMIQANFEAQKAVEERQREKDILELEVETLRYQQNYYNSDEFKDLEARSKLGLAGPGEKSADFAAQQRAGAAAGRAGFESQDGSR